MPSGAISQYWVAAMMTAQSEIEAIRMLIDQGIRCEMDAGQIVSREEFDRAISEGNQRDMAVAKEVVKSLCWVLDAKITEHFNEEYLLPVIARVNQ